MSGSQTDMYFTASKGVLKLKGVQESGIKKKKKKKSSKMKSEELMNHSTGGNSIASSGTISNTTATRTKAEVHFMERQRLREEERIMKKAAKSHKEKVETFNRNLDAQSEHFDIPKVSWTK